MGTHKKLVGRVHPFPFLCFLPSPAFLSPPLICQPFPFSISLPSPFSDSPPISPPPLICQIYPFSISFLQTFCLQTFHPSPVASTSAQCTHWGSLQAVAPVVGSEHPVLAEATECHLAFATLAGGHCLTVNASVYNPTGLAECAKMGAEETSPPDCPIIADSLTGA